MRPHVRHRFDGRDEAWWTPPSSTRRSRRPRTTWARAEQLAQVLERLALLVEVGQRLSTAIDGVVGAGRGPVVAELDTVAVDLRAGVSPPDALTAWARRVGCPVVGVLAAEIRRSASSDDVVAALYRHAAAQRELAHRRRVELLRVRVATVWLMAALAVVGSVLSMVR
ncbi:hypothetical protein BH23ACT10_BH23ACT10_05520 [soil metagenome]